MFIGMALTNVDVMLPDRPCPKCGTTRSRLVGRALSPPALIVQVVQCAGCGYTSLASNSPPAQPRRLIDRRRIERLVNEAIHDLQSAAHLVAVTEVADGWQITIQRAPRHIDQFFLEPGPLVEIYAAIRKGIAGPGPAILRRAARRRRAASRSAG
jgi:hypothetical protein